MAGKREGDSSAMATPRDVDRVPHAVLVLAKVDDDGTVLGYYYPKLCQIDEDKGTAAIQTCIVSSITLPVDVVASITLPVEWL